MKAIHLLQYSLIFVNVSKKKIQMFIIIMLAQVH